MRNGEISINLKFFRILIVNKHIMLQFVQAHMLALMLEQVQLLVLEVLLEKHLTLEEKIMRLVSTSQ